MPSIFMLNGYGVNSCPKCGRQPDMQHGLFGLVAFQCCGIMRGEYTRLGEAVHNWNAATINFRKCYPEECEDYEGDKND